MKAERDHHMENTLHRWIVNKLKPAILAYVSLFVLAGLLRAGTIPAPGSGVAVPTGTWTMVLTRGIPESSNDWEQLVYAPVVQRSIMLSQYHQTNSEPNESLVGYNFDTNSWDILDMGGLFHTENMPEGGESQGYFDFNPNNNTLVYHCCTTGSNQSENVNHTWWFDLLGQSGRDKQTTPEPPFPALQPGGAFDVAHNVFVLHGGASFVGTWTYNPVSNNWQPRTPGGTPPDPSVILPAMAYSSNAQQVFLFGGRVGSNYLSDLYAYNASLSTWTLISPAGGVKPPGRYRTNFAYDSTNNIFLLFGGQNASGVLGDTWVYDPAANAWTQLSPPQSPAIGSVADFSRLCYDSDHNVFVLAHKGSGGYFGGNWVTLSIQTWLFRYRGAGPNAGTLLSTAQPAAGSVNRNTAGWAKDPALASSGNSLYVAWSETGSPFTSTQEAWPHVYASQYASGSWAAMGSSYQSISGASVEAHAPSLAVIGTTPWISWYQANGSSSSGTQVFAAAWNGLTWQGGPIGLVGSATNQSRSQLVNVGSVPYVGFLEVSKSTYPQSAFAYVKAWNGTSWALQGTGALNRSAASGSTATSVSVASDGSNPYAAWTEYVRSTGSNGADVATNPQVYASYWNGSQWVPLGGSLNVNSSGWATDASIAFFSGQPYVAWTERSQVGNAQLYVATWNNTSWVQTSAGSLNQGGANGWAYHPSLVADAIGKNLYVAWVEQTALGQKAQVFVSQLAGNSWITLGSALNADGVQGSAQRVSLGVLNSQPVATWSEVDLGALRQVYVAQWNGSAWTRLLGTGGAPDTTAPSTPKNLSATAVSPSQINLAWSSSTDAVGVTGYQVYRNGAQVGTVTSSVSYQDTGLSPSVAYSYTVAAYDAAGNVSGQSLRATATTLPSTVQPTVSLTAPASGATLSGTISVSANATDSTGIAGVQFQLDGTNLGGVVTGSGPSYSTSWNTTTTSNGPHNLSVIATNTVGASATSSESVTVNNPAVPVEPVISAVSATSITSSGARISWNTDEAASSQVAYGTTPAYGLTTTLDSTLVTAHSVTLSGLSPSTTYHYQVLSRDALGNLNSSGDFTLMTSPAGLQTLLLMQSNPSELSGQTNGSVVTPTTAPTGFTGTVVVNGNGSVNFTPAQGGNGVYFLTCCKVTNDAYFRFTSASVGNVFNVNQGQISFFLESRYSFAQRQSTAAAARYTFDVRDGSGTHLFYFLTQVTSKGLQFNYVIGGKVLVYYVPQGTEDTLFGSGVILQVALAWSASGASLSFNGTVVKSSSYTAPSPNWTATSNFDLGAYEYANAGGYSISDDVIGNFSVSGPASP